MSLDNIQQNTRKIIELYRMYANYDRSDERAEKIKKGILNLAYDIKKLINEERQNAD